VRSLGFILNEGLTTTDHFRKVCQRVYWNLLSLRTHAAHSSFEVRGRLVLSLILPHVNYGTLCLVSCIQGLIIFLTWN
jgi:hypothetical protein